MLRVDVRADWPETSAWDALVQADKEATPFQTRDWLTTWWQHYGGSSRPFIVEAHFGSELVGLFFLFRPHGVWTVIRSMGAGPSDYLQPICEPSVRGEVHEAMLAFLMEQPGLVDLHQWRIPEAPTGAVAQATCLVVDLPATYDTYLATLSKSLRYDARRFERDKELDVRDDLPIATALDILFEQHKRRWRSRGLPGAFLGRARRFHEAWAPLAERQGILRLGVLEKAGSPIGSIYAFTMHGRCYYYQAGFEPEASALSPGTLLVAHTLKRAIEDGAAQFDFCRGDEPYKRRWKPDRVETNYRVLMAGSGLGRVGEAWNRWAWRVEERIRAKLEGGSLLPRRPRIRNAEQA